MTTLFHSPLLAALVTLLYSQGTPAPTGAVAGKIVDEQSAPLPGVTVSATLNGHTQTTTTNANGEYRLDALPPGAYRLLASISGFVPTTADRTIVEARRVTDWNVPLMSIRPAGTLSLVGMLRGYVERFTGPQAIDCGQHLLSKPSMSSIDADTRQRSVACGTDAMQKRQPFWTFWQEQGVDSWIANGLLGTTEGVLYRFDYDSAPCGGSGCGDRFAVESCANPRIVRRIVVAGSCSRVDCSRGRGTRSAPSRRGSEAGPFSLEGVNGNVVPLIAVGRSAIAMSKRAHEPA